MQVKLGEGQTPCKPAIKKEKKKKEYVVLEVRDNVQMYSAAAFKGSLHTP